MTKREFLGDEFYLLMKQDYDKLRTERKAQNGKPDQYQLAQSQLNKLFESFYKKRVTT